MAKELYNAGARQAGGLGIGTDGSAPCLRADDHPAAVALRRGGCAVFENHAQDSRVREMPDVSPTQGAQLCNAPANNPLVVTQYGADLAGTLRAEGADSSPTDSGGQNAVAIGFKGGQSANGGLGDEREVAPTLAAQPSALEPTVAVGLDLYNQAETGGGGDDC